MLRQQPAPAMSNAATDTSGLPSYRTHVNNVNSSQQLNESLLHKASRSQLEQHQLASADQPTPSAPFAQNPPRKKRGPKAGRKAALAAARAAAASAEGWPDSQAPDPYAFTCASEGANLQGIDRLATNEQATNSRASKLNTASTNHRKSKQQQQPQPQAQPPTTSSPFADQQQQAKTFDAKKQHQDFDSISNSSNNHQNRRFMHRNRHDLNPNSSNIHTSGQPQYHHHYQSQPQSQYQEQFHTANDYEFVDSIEAPNPQLVHSPNIVSSGISRQPQPAREQTMLAYKQQPIVMAPSKAQGHGQGGPVVPPSHQQHQQQQDHGHAPIYQQHQHMAPSDGQDSMGHPSGQYYTQEQQHPSQGYQQGSNNRPQQRQYPPNTYVEGHPVGRPVQQQQPTQRLSHPQMQQHQQYMPPANQTYQQQQPQQQLRGQPQNSYEYMGDTPGAPSKQAQKHQVQQQPQVRVQMGTPARPFGPGSRQDMTQRPAQQPQQMVSPGQSMEVAQVGRPSGYQQPLQEQPNTQAIGHNQNHNINHHTNYNGANQTHQTHLSHHEEPVEWRPSNHGQPQQQPPQHQPQLVPVQYHNNSNPQQHHQQHPQPQQTFAVQAVQEQGRRFGPESPTLLQQQLSRQPRVPQPPPQAAMQRPAQGFQTQTPIVQQEHQQHTQAPAQEYYGQPAPIQRGSRLSQHQMMQHQQHQQNHLGNPTPPLTPTSVRTATASSTPTSQSWQQQQVHGQPPTPMHAELGAYGAPSGHLTNQRHLQPVQEPPRMSKACAYVDHPVEVLAPSQMHSQPDMIAVRAQPQLQQVTPGLMYNQPSVQLQQQQQHQLPVMQPQPQKPLQQCQTRLTLPMRDSLLLGPFKLDQQIQFNNSTSTTSKVFHINSQLFDTLNKSLNLQQQQQATTATVIHELQLRAYLTMSLVTQSHAHNNNNHHGHHNHHHLNQGDSLLANKQQVPVNGRQCSWPELLQVAINQNQLRLDTRASVRQHQAANIGPLCRPGNNTIDLSVGDCYSSYEFIIEAVERPLLKAFVSTCLKSCVKNIPKCVQKLAFVINGHVNRAKQQQHPQQQMGLGWLPSEFVTVFSHQNKLEIPKVKISLTCPISGQRIRNPTRGQNCKHIQCFDLESFLHHNRDTSFWTCPLCSAPISFNKMEIDELQMQILSKMSDNHDTDEVMLSESGNWQTYYEQPPAQMKMTQKPHQQQPPQHQHPSPSYHHNQQQQEFVGGQPQTMQQPIMQQRPPPQAVRHGPNPHNQHAISGPARPQMSQQSGVQQVQSLSHSPQHWTEHPNQTSQLVADQPAPMQHFNPQQQHQHHQVHQQQPQQQGPQKRPLKAGTPTGSRKTSSSSPPPNSHQAKRPYAGAYALGQPQSQSGQGLMQNQALPQAQSQPQSGSQSQGQGQSQIQSQPQAQASPMMYQPPSSNSRVALNQASSEELSPLAAMERAIIQQEQQMCPPPFDPTILTASGPIAQQQQSPAPHRSALDSPSFLNSNAESQAQPQAQPQQQFNQRNSAACRSSFSPVGAASPKNLNSHGQQQHQFVSNTPATPSSATGNSLIMHGGPETTPSTSVTSNSNPVVVPQAPPLGTSPCLANSASVNQHVVDHQPLSNGSASAGSIISSSATMTPSGQSLGSVGMGGDSRCGTAPGSNCSNLDHNLGVSSHGNLVGNSILHDGSHESTSWKRQQALEARGKSEHLANFLNGPSIKAHAVTQPNASSQSMATEAEVAQSKLLSASPGEPGDLDAIDSFNYLDSDCADNGVGLPPDDSIFDLFER